MFSYCSFGLKFNSMLELPGLPVVPPVHLPDVRISFGPVPTHLHNAIEKGAYFEIAPRDCLLHSPGVGRYRITDGCEIIIDREPGGSSEELRSVIYAAAFGVLFHQRGLVPVHASAIAAGNGCLAFAGPSHAGKSTLANYLKEQGYPVVADDICLLSCNPGQQVLAFPGVPSIRLWKEALELFGRTTDGYQRVAHTKDKYHAPPGITVTAQALPLLGVVQISTPDKSRTTPFHQLYGLDAVGVLMDEAFWGGFRKRMGASGSYFLAAVAIANQIPIYRCNLEKNWDRMHAFKTFIESQFACES